MHERWRALVLLVRMAFKADPWRVVGLVIEPIGMMAVPVFAYCLKLLADGVIQHDTRLLAFGAAGIAVTRAVWFIGTWTGSWIRVRLMEEVGFGFDTEIATLTARLPGLEHHERADVQDRLELLRQSHGSLGYALNSLIWTAHSVVAGAAAIVVLAVLSPWMLLLVLFALPALPVASVHQRWAKHAEERSAAPSRLAQHLRGLTVDRNARIELRVFGLQEEILSRFESTWLDSKRPALDLERRMAILGSARDVFFMIGFGAAVAFTLWRAGRGQATAGDVIMAVYLCQRIRRQVVDPIQAVAGLGEVLRAAGRMVWLRDYADHATDLSRGDKPAPDSLTDGILFDHVSFRYPGTRKWVLQDLTLHIPAGSTVALVGENGAGKTTLVKLLCRMYEPTEGRILVDGVDIADIDVKAWRLRLSAAFQDFARLELTAQHTVGVGDLPEINNPTAVQNALDRAGATDVLTHLPEGADSRLGASWDGGAELSTGQWQKLALGRTLMRPQPLLTFFDEPTASLDAHTEHGLFARYAQVARNGARVGAITVLISHRFSTVRAADLILVLDNGQLTEAGSHTELLANNGLYADLYTLQAQSYH
ncbi:ABC transporter ATP-binding protein [Actinopolymorpha pittospori]